LHRRLAASFYPRLTVPHGAFKDETDMLRRLQWIGVMCGLCLLTSCSEDASSMPVRTYPMGDRVQLGPLIYTVFESQWMTQLGEGAVARIPEHRFFLVRMSVTNGGASEVIVPAVALIDDNGGSHLELSNGEHVPRWIGFLRQMKPAETTQGNLVFDVPPGHYKLRISDESEQRQALIDIPLSFGAETPMTTTPLEK
jgi:hypothetical protein